MMCQTKPITILIKGARIMTALTFRDTCDVDRLFRLIDNCIGPVYLKTGSDKKIDLRRNEEVKSLLSEACSNNVIEKMSVEINDQRDMPKIIDYLLSCNHSSKLVEV